MKRTLLTIGGTALFVLLLVVTSKAQMNQTPAPGTPPASPAPSGQMPSGQLPSGQLPGAGQPATPAAPVLNKDEEAAYKAFYESLGPDPTKQIQLGEDFLTKYPDSRYIPIVYSRLALDYMEANDEDKMIAAAQKAIDLNPDNPDALSLMVWAMARKTNSSALGASEEFLKLENYGHRAITLISTMAKPTAMDDAQFTAAKNDKLAMCYSGLGIIEFKTQKYDDSVSDLTQAVQLANSPDPVDYFILGHADEAVSHYQDAIAAYSKCTDDGPVQARCKAGLDDAKQKALTTPAPAPAPAPSAAPAPPKS
jgi:tetratricopeptide (TPR) repeat protein